MNIPKLRSLIKVAPLEIKCSTYATVFIFSAAALLAVAFVTPFWLECKKIPDQRFLRIGLWEACFARIHDHYHRYDRVISGCKWMFDKDYSFLMDYLEPPFFIATQVLFTLGFLLLLLVCLGILAVQRYFIIEREDYALRALSVASIISAISCSSAVILFAIYGNRDDWMPDSEHNYFSWSFGAASLGSFLLWIASLLYFILYRTLRQLDAY